MRGIQAGMLAVLFCMVMTLSGCEKGMKKAEERQEETVIPVTFSVNPDTGENENEELVDAFNKEYEGTYRLEVEWITDTAEGYRSRIKSLNALDKLPAIITDVGFDADFYELLVKNGRLVDLTPYIEADGQWKSIYTEPHMKKFSEEGSIYLAPGGNDSMSYGGFFYRKDLFEKVGIEEFPDDWDTFFSCLEDLKAEGITPLAIHGGSSYWTSLLIATAYMAGNKEGMDFLEVQYPQDYDKPEVADMFAMQKRLYQYTDQDALDIERTEAARRFVQGEAAITANGGWMIMNFTKEEKDQIGFAPFPGNLLMEDAKMSAWAATAGYSKGVTEGAAEFLKFRAIQGQEQETEYFTSKAVTTVEKEYKSAVLAEEKIMPNYQLKWEEGIQEEFLVNMLPPYIRSEIMQEEFLAKLNEAVRAINMEK